MSAPTWGTDSFPITIDSTFRPVFTQTTGTQSDKHQRGSAISRFFLLLADSFIFFRFYFYQYMVAFLFNTVIYVFLLLRLCILIVQLPWLRFLHAFSSVVRQMPGYNSPRRGTARTVPIYFCVVPYIVFFLCCSVYCLCVNVYCTAATGCQPNCN
jgi:hypothetical protein